MRAKAARWGGVGQGVSVANQLTDIGNWNSRFLRTTTTTTHRLDDCEIRWRRWWCWLAMELLKLWDGDRARELEMASGGVFLIREGAWLTDWVSSSEQANRGDGGQALSLCMQYKFYMHKYTSVFHSTCVCVCAYLYTETIFNQHLRFHLSHFSKDAGARRSSEKQQQQQHKQQLSNLLTQ